VANDLATELTEDTLNQLEIEDVLTSEMGQLCVNAMPITKSGGFHENMCFNTQQSDAIERDVFVGEGDRFRLAS
jgi:hypothetical protein